ncbi:hypothetical protein DNTS_031155 [Danionella cerebrum]|uniref:Uncharacterized protein n=1 Tax=Danionella cerebrum TaxID=2873325 RepID=A0A553MLS1_9TELE|nr:hypothetical protein DNTS_031155 [Danionella translucida]
MCDAKRNTMTMQTTEQPLDNSTLQDYADLIGSLVTSSSPVTGASTVNCFIDAQLAFIITAAASGIILILLTSVIVLACTNSRLKRHNRRAPRASRSNVDLVSGTGYWGPKRKEGGIVGPCETSVLLEEMKTDGEEEEVNDGAVGCRKDIYTPSKTSSEIVQSTSKASTIDISSDSKHPVQKHQRMSEF